MLRNVGPHPVGRHPRAHVRPPAAPSAGEPVGDSPGASLRGDLVDELRLIGDQRTAILSGWQSSPAEGNALTRRCSATSRRSPPSRSTTSRLVATTPPASRQSCLGRRPRRVLRRCRLRPTVDRPRFSGAAGRLHRRVVLRYDPVFDGYASIFKGADGKTYGLPKDGNTIAMAYNTALVPTPPKTMDELVTLAQSLKGQGWPQGAAAC